MRLLRVHLLKMDYKRTYINFTDPKNFDIHSVKMGLRTI